LLLDRQSDLLVIQIEALREAVRQVRARAPFHIDDWVVLPDHMHCLWTLPEGDADSLAAGARSSKSLRIGEPRSPVMIRRGERGIWQRRYWEHTIRDEQDFATHFDYVHFNPVKHGFVEHPAEWPHSSFRLCVADGLYPAGWMRSAGEPSETVSGDDSNGQSRRRQNVSFQTVIVG
jgi:putative transposase